MLYKMTNEDYINDYGEYIIYIDNALPLEMEIVDKDGNAKNCWLKKADYILPLDKYKAIYRAYNK